MPTININYGNMWKLHVRIQCQQGYEKKNDKKRISPVNLIAYILTPIIKELKISVKHGGNNVKYNQTLNIIFSVVENNFLHTLVHTCPLYI